MTDVRTFRAASMQEALDLVRQEMGGEAVILHTRQVARRRWLPWVRHREDVEITAGLGVNVRPAAARRRAAGAAGAAGAATLERPATVSAEPAAAALATARLDVVTPDAPEIADSFAPAEGRGQIPESVLPPSEGDMERPAAAPVCETLPAETAPAAAEAPVPSVEAHAHGNSAAFAEQLSAIRKMLENLTTHSRPAGAAEIPAELFDLYAELIDAEVEDALAREFVLLLKQNATPAQLQDPAATRALLTALVEADLCVGGPIAVTPGRRKVVALVGSTGVGKTTTIAKLAANFRLRDGIRMGLVTVDTYRIAAVEQLRTYAEIIDLPMKVVTSPPEMRRAMDELLGLDLVLIDTAGRSPRDELQIQELKRLLAEAGTDDVQLVLSLTASLRSLEATIEKFRAVNTTGLILTKLDEAAGMGTLLSLARKVPLPVSYLTTGQDVPDDIEPANKSRMARLILGQDRL